MRYSTGLVACGMFAVAGAAGAAEFSATITAASDYDFRGISQTDRRPALQASLDLGLGGGFYVGAWASNVDFGGDEDVEIDYYGGWAREFENGASVDFGINYYSYPGDHIDADYAEYYMVLGYRNAAFETWYANDYVGTGMDAVYYKGSYEWAVNDDWTVTFHAGYSTGEFFNTGFGAGHEAPHGSYWDYGAAVTRAIGNFEVGLQLVGTEIGSAYRDLTDRGKAVLTISTTLPWSKE